MMKAVFRNSSLEPFEPKQIRERADADVVKLSGVNTALAETARQLTPQTSLLASETARAFSRSQPTRRRVCWAERTWSAAWTRLQSRWS
jgi:hypothetical protein